MAVSSEAVESATVKPVVPTDSDGLEVPASKAAEGAGSLSVSVSVWITVPPRAASIGLLRVICTVSSVSSSASSVTWTVMVFSVCPAVKVRVPAVRVKSVPEAVAVPPVTAYWTVTVCPDAEERLTGTAREVSDSEPLEEPAPKATVTGDSLSWMV